MKIFVWDEYAEKIWLSSIVDNSRFIDVQTKEKPLFQNEYVIKTELGVFWYDNLNFHRLNGPAVEYANGGKEWYVNGKLHREDGPSIDYADGYKEWRVNGELHREDGPAVEYADGGKAWYLHGENLAL